MAVRWLNEVAGLCATNDVEQAAVKHALIHSFSLIQGPPGTGRTLTAVRLAALFIRINRSLPAKYHGDQDRKPQLLICGPSNKSVDVIASEFIVIVLWNKVVYVFSGDKLTSQNEENVFCNSFPRT